MLSIAGWRTALIPSPTFRRLRLTNSLYITFMVRSMTCVADALPQLRLTLSA